MIMINKLKNIRMLRYLVVAISIVLVELTFFQAIYLTTHNYILGTVLSFVLAVLLNWVLGRKVVFGASQHHPAKEFIMVLIASSIGLGIQIGVVYTSVTVLKLYPLIGKVLSIGFSFFWNYWFRAKIIYKNTHRTTEEKILDAVEEI
jgi:putative flippase GtrA